MVELSEIREFSSPEHYVNFVNAIGAAVADGELEEVDVKTPYASLMFDEKWYRSASGGTWRLVKPDFPFKGVFLRVNDPGSS